MKVIKNISVLTAAVILSLGQPGASGQTSGSGVPVTELYVQTGHTSFIHAVAFSIDSALLASGGEDNTIKLWSAVNGLELKTLKGHYSWITSLAFSSRGGRLVSGSSDWNIKVWDIGTGQELNTLTGHRGDVNAVAISPDDRFIASGADDGTVRLWDARSGAGMKVFSKHTGAVNTVAFSPNGKMIASGGDDDAIRFWDLASGKEVKTLPAAGSHVKSVVFAPDGKTLASSGLDNTIRIWNTISGTRQKTLSGHTNAIDTLAFSKDGKLLASGSWDETVRLWDVASWRHLKTLKGHSSVVGSVQFSPDGKRLASGAFDRTVKLWDVAKGVELQSLERHTHYPLSIAISPDSKLMALSDDARAVKLWHLASRTLLKILDTHGPSASPVRPGETLPDGPPLARATAFSHDSTTLAVGYDDGYIELFDVRSGQKLRAWKGHEGGIDSVAFSPKDNLLATGSDDRSVKLWDANTEKGIRTYAHDSYVNLVVFSGDGKIITGGTVQDTIKRWDTDSDKLLSSFSSKDIEARKEEMPELYRAYHKIVADGRLRLKEGENGRIDFYNTSTDKLVMSFVALDSQDWAVVSADGRFDTSKLEGPLGLHWIMSDAPLAAVPFEVFMRGYYEPKLMPRLLEGEELTELPALADLNRVQPSVRVVSARPGRRPDVAAVTVEVSSAEGQFLKGGRRVTARTDVHDLRLFRDGQLVGQWPEPKPGTSVDGGGTKLTPAELRAWQAATRIGVNPKTGRAKLTFNVRLPHGKAGQGVLFSAYAFNLDRVKSATATLDYAIPRGLAPLRPRAYIVSFGVNAYENPRWDLRFAVNDASLMKRALTERLNKQYEVVPVELVSDYEVVHGERKITANHATRESLRAALQALAGRRTDSAALAGVVNAEKLSQAVPDDLVLIAVSSHGYTDASGQFYLIPSGSGNTDGWTIRPELLRKWVSSDDLSGWLREVDAGEMIMIVDTCHSAATVDAPGFRPGPMGSRGLGQLAYDKGMRILAASQADDVALENEKLKQGLLTYALVRDGLEAGQADHQPKDGRITLDEWLTYAVERVPTLYEEVKEGRVQTFQKWKKGPVVEWIGPTGAVSLKKNAFQLPSLFDFNRKAAEVILVDSPE